MSVGDPREHRDRAPQPPEGERQSRQIHRRIGAYLPHWTLEGGTYSVTFRLGDSLPATVLRALVREREGTLRRAEALGRELTVYERQRLDLLYSERVERYLDAGHGACYMRDPRVASLVRDALLHFDGDRCDIVAWCIMPNHVHVVVRPLGRHSLSSLLHTWKSFTATAANRVLGRSGQFWQAESYDHLIRDHADLCHAVAYVLNNPAAAGLLGWPWVGPGDLVRKVRRSEDTG